MQAMPYRTQGKGVVEISAISFPTYKLHQRPEEEEEEEVKNIRFEELQVPVNKTCTKIGTYSGESEPISTLDTPTRKSPGSPTSTSTLSSFSPENTAGVADPECPNKQDWPPELENGSGHGGGGSGGGLGPGPGEMGSGGGLGIEEWDSMFPNGDGALLPWIMGEADDMGLGLKHLLQSGNNNNPVVDYEGNAGLGVVEQGSELESLPPSPPPPPPRLGGGGGGGGLISSSGVNNNNNNNDLGFNCSSGFVNNAEIGSISSPNCSSGVFDCRGINSLGLFQAGGCGGLGFPQHQFDVGDEKPQIFNPQLVMNQHQIQSMSNPSFLMPPLGYFQLEQHLIQQPQPKRHNPGVVLDPNLTQLAKNPFVEPGYDMLRKQQQQLGLQQMGMGMGQQKSMLVHKQSQEQAIKDQLFKAADLIQAGNPSLAQEILARLNHHLPLPANPPLLRAALYVKEALQLLILMMTSNNPVAAPPPKMLTPYDVVHKMDAYKVFSEVSPVTQFVNFTCTQAILEALDDGHTIHIIDFDIGCGAQWASLIHELPLRKNGTPALKISALVSLSTIHPFELSLIRENLEQFASESNVVFELQVVNLDLCDPSSSSLSNLGTSEDEAIAVSIPIWALSYRPSVLPSILRFIKQRCPKIVVSFDRGFDRSDVPFPQHLIHTLDSCSSFLESLDGINLTSEIVNKVEKFFIQPRIENSVLGRLHSPEKMPHWKSVFGSTGFMPLQFSNFTDTQADYVVKRSPGRGFHVEKRQASLVLLWQRQELVVASAWRC